MTRSRIVVTDPVLLASVQLAVEADQRLRDTVIVTDECNSDEVVGLARDWENSLQVYEADDIQEPYWIQLNNNSKPWRRK